MSAQDKNKSNAKNAAAGGYSPCKVTGCKHSPVKFNFCTTHFDQFKFGLITKNGAAVPDYEKKLEQWEAQKKTA